MKVVDVLRKLYPDLHEAVNYNKAPLGYFSRIWGYARARRLLFENQNSNIIMGRYNGTMAVFAVKMKHRNAVGEQYFYFMIGKYSLHKVAKIGFNEFMECYKDLGIKPKTLSGQQAKKLISFETVRAI